MGVGDLDSEYLCLCQDLDSLLAADVVCNLGGVRGIVPERSMGGGTHVSALLLYN